MPTNQKAQFFFGVEGGATKSAGVVMDTHGTVIFQIEGKALNYHATGENITTQNLKELLDALTAYVSEHDGETKCAVFGLAGLDSPEDEEAYNKIVHSLLPISVQRRVVNDSIVNLHARCDAPASIIVISGTGSNVCGEYGDISWFGGGQGHLASDEGSGYDAGSRVIHAAVSSWLERIPYTLLQNDALSHAGVKTMSELIALQRKINSQEPERYKSFVASFSYVLDSALKRGDFRAREIREIIASELAQGVYAVYHHCKMERQRVCLSLVGGNFNTPGLSDLLKKKILEIVPRAYFSANEDSGAIGAARMAMELEENVVLPSD